jgi:thioredoxin-dependent adenylylsulfate APS reductase
MAARISQGTVRVFTIDTGRLPEETYQLIAEVRERYGINIEVVLPDAMETANMVSMHGPNLFRESVSKRRMCCEVRKVRPLKRKLAELDAWVTGLTRGQSATRRHVAKVETDPQHDGILKLCPLADWPRNQVWDYIRDHRVPYHKLYTRGYESIGCAPCTRATLPEEDSRAGRWWWETDALKECGLHFSPAGVRREVDVLVDQVVGAAS